MKHNIKFAVLILLVAFLLPVIGCEPTKSSSSGGGTGSSRDTVAREVKVKTETVKQ